MFQSRLRDENTDARLGIAPNKDVLMSAKKTAFSDVKNLLGHTNTPNVPGKASGLKKPVFGQLKSKLQPSEMKIGPSVAAKRNYKPRIDLSAIDYSDSEPHFSCKAYEQNDILYDFWSAASTTKVEVFKDPEPVRKRKVDLPDMSFVQPPAPATDLDHLPNLFDDFPLSSFSDL